MGLREAKKRKKKKKPTFREVTDMQQFLKIQSPTYHLKNFLLHLHTTRIITYFTFLKDTCIMAINEKQISHSICTSNKHKI